MSVDADRLRARARHLRTRAARRPIGSNGRRKDVARAELLERRAAAADAAELAARRAVAAARGLWTPRPASPVLSEGPRTHDRDQRSSPPGSAARVAR